MRIAHDWGQALRRPRRITVTSGSSSRHHLAFALAGLAAIAACSDSATAPSAADNTTSDQVAIARESNLVTVEGVQYPLVAIAPNQSTMNVGEHVTFQAHLSGGNGEHWMGRYITWTSSNDAVISISTTGWGSAGGDQGVAVAHKTGTATITGRTQSKTVGAITITVGGSGSGGGGGGGTPAPPPPSSIGGSGGGHEPSGMYTQINTGSIHSTGVVQMFSPGSTNGNGESSSNLSVAPGGGLRLTYRPNLSGGYSPVRFGMNIASPGTGWYYQRMRIRFSSNWTLSGNVQLKLCEPRTEQQGPIQGANENHVLAVHDFDTRSTHAWFYGFLQGPWGQSRDLFEQPTYSSGANLNDGQWHTVEVLFQPESSPGSGNGGYTAWVDGSQVEHYTNVEWLAAGNVRGWPYLMFDPTYGGGPNHPSSTMYWDFDQLFVSTK